MYFVVRKRPAVKNSFSTYIWSKVNSCFCEALYVYTRDKEFISGLSLMMEYLLIAINAFEVSSFKCVISSYRVGG